MAVLEKHRCLNCKKETVVARVSPCDEPEKLTGMWLSEMDDFYTEKTVGVLCADCAFKLCDEGKVTLGFSGGLLGNLDNWSALLSRSS